MGVLAVLLVVQLAVILPFAHSTLSPIESATLATGNNLVINSDQSSIQSVVVRGNLTGAKWSNTTFPAKSFTLTSNTTGAFTLNVWSSYVGQYTTIIKVVNPLDGSSSQVASYLVSGGDLNLTIIAAFQPPGPGSGEPMGIPSFYEWLSQFGGAFPAWIKILYGVLAVQFGLVGFTWVRFEDERRRTEGHLPPLDAGNKVYLWTDIVFKALLVGFAVSLAIMVGESLVVGIAQYLFLVNLAVVSLVDFFSLFFFAVVASLVYLAREGMDRLLDLKPIMED